MEEKIIKCKGCSKESYDIVPIARIISKLDEFFATNDLCAVGRLLEYWEREARNLGDKRGLIEILNEEIGYYRRTSDKEKALAAVKEAFELVDELDCADTESSGTLYLNGATTMKAFGLAAESLEYYKKAKEIYDRHLSPNDYKMAAFYNNISSAYVDLGDVVSAEECCNIAIEILKKHSGCEGEIAVTLINLAHMYHNVDPCDEKIYDNVDKAYQILKSYSGKYDGNFAFLCSKCYPSFGFFGYFEYEMEIRTLTEKIYAGN
jgi:tetratricopeptide (TPR) repeat protein